MTESQTTNRTKRFTLKRPYWSDIYEGDQVVLRVAGDKQKEFSQWVVEKLNAKN